MAERIRTHLISDSIKEHYEQMLTMGSQVMDVDMHFSVIGKDGVEEKDVVMFLVSAPHVATRFRQVLEDELEDDS